MTDRSLIPINDIVLGAEKGPIGKLHSCCENISPYLAAAHGHCEHGRGDNALFCKTKRSRERAFDVDLEAATCRLIMHHGVALSLEARK